MSTTISGYFNGITRDAKRNKKKTGLTATFCPMVFVRAGKDWRYPL